MANYSVAWGLDIGISSVKAVKLNRSGGEVVVDGYAVEPIVHAEGDERYEKVADALRALAAHHDLANDPVFVALSGKQIFSKTIKLPVLNPKSLHRMVELEARQQIPGDFDSLYWGFHLSPSTQDDGTYDVALFAARKDIVQRLIDDCHAVGINLAGITVTGLAVYNFIAYDQEFEDDESVIVLDVGAENTDLVVYHGDALWMRNLRVSGNDITRAFMKKLRVNFAEAERLKQEVNQSKQADRIMRVIEGSLQDLASEIQRSLGFYKGQNSNANFQNVVVCGNTFRLEMLSEYMANRLGYPIIALVELERIGMAPSLDRDVFLDELQGMSTSMGLALQGIGRAKADVNLLPSDVLLQQVLETKKWAPVAVLVILILAFALSWTIQSSRLDEYASNIRRIERFVEDEGESQEQAVSLITSLQPLSKTLKQLDQVGHQRWAVHSIQARILAVLDELLRDEALWLRDNGRPAADQNGDPVRQPFYLDGLTVPLPPSAGEQVPIFTPFIAKRTVNLSLRIPSRPEFQRINRRVIEALEQIEIGPTLAAVYGVAPETRLFAAVGPGQTRQGTDTWRYLDGFHTDASGNAAPIDESRRLPVTVAEFKCELTELKPDFAGQGG